VAERTLEQARTDLRLLCAATSIWQPMARVGELSLPSGHGSSIAARLYEPFTGRPGHRPLLVWFHGGGFVLGDLETADPTCRALAQRSGALVLSVDYRRAPDPGCLAAVEDACSALRWALAHAAALGGDPRRVIVGGESAGGALAALASLRCRDDGGPMPALQVLVYPCTELSMALADHQPGTAQLLTWESVDWFAAHCFRNLDPSSPKISAYRAQRHDGLPPARVITAECDLLYSDGEAYAARLADSGTPVTLTRYPGQIHGFFTMDLLFPAARRAQREVGRAIAALAPGPREARPAAEPAAVSVVWRHPISGAIDAVRAFSDRLPVTTLARAGVTVLRHKFQQFARAIP